MWSKQGFISLRYVNQLKQQRKLKTMKIVSKANNVNNSRITLEYYGSIAEPFITTAKKHSCGYSSNVTTALKPDHTGMRKSFGTISFNKGNHQQAYTEFMEFLKTESFKKTTK